jgi:hypothetical protein
MNIAQELLARKYKSNKSGYYRRTFPICYLISGVNMKELALIEAIEQKFFWYIANSHNILTTPSKCITIRISNTK